MTRTKLLALAVVVSRCFGFLILCSVSVSALPQNHQNSPQPHQVRLPSLADQERFVSYWTTETGWKSELQLRNNVVGQDLIVTPVMRLADGAETKLAPVTIKPQEVKSVDLDTAISAAGAPQLVGTYGSVVLRYRSPSAASLYTAMMIRRTGHAVAFHIDAIGESQEFQVGGREGIWWLPNDTASDYLILTNQGGNAIPLDLSLYDASGKMSTQKILLGSRETTRYSVRTLVQAAHLAGSYGGIKISAAAHAGSLDTLHFLFDEKAEFAAILKMFDHDQNSKLEERDYAKTAVWTLRAPMLALSNPDPALAFPPDTTLHPQLFVRNTTGKHIDAAVRFNWRTANSTGKAPGPAVRLAPYETRRIDVAALQNGTLPKEANWTSVTITTNSKPDELMAVAASYDSTLRYGAQTPFSDQLTFRWEGGMWEYDPYHNSIITAGNGGTKPTEAAFTIFYNQGTQRYDLEKNLQPDEQMWIDVGKLIREHVPDKSGKTLPSDLTMGSYEFRDLTNTGVGTLFEGKVIYDKTYGHVAYGCAGCCGYSFPYTWYDPLGVPFGGPAEQGVYAPDTRQGGAAADVSASFYNAWSVYSTATATVDYYGTHTGQSIGSTTSKTSGVLLSNGPRLCPSLTRTPSGGVNVVDGFTVGYNAYIAVDHITSATSCLFASTFNTPLIYIGDANRGTYRTAEQIFVMPDLQNYSGYFEDTGQSRNYGYGSPANGPTLSSADEDGIPNDCYLWNNANKISQPFSYDVSFPFPHQAQVHYVGSAYNPLEDPHATITWDMRTVLDTTSPLSPTAYVNYNHTCYPAHQIKVNGAVVYSYIPPSDSPQQLLSCLVFHDFKLVGQTLPMVVPTH